MTGLYYDKANAAKIGMTNPPASVEELTALMAKAKSAGLVPMVVHNKEGGGVFPFQLLLNSMLGPDKVAAWVFNAPDATIDTPEAVKAAQQVADWNKAGYFPDGVNGLDANAADALFASGKAVFFPWGNWDAANIDKTLPGKAGFIPMPPATAGGQLGAMSDAATAFGIPAKAKNKDAAALFLDFLSSDEARQIAVDNGFMPSGTDDQAAPTIPAGSVKNDVVAAFKQVSAAGGQTPFVQNATAGISNQAWNPETQLLLGGKSDPQKYVANIQAKYAERTGSMTSLDGMTAPAAQAGAVAPARRSSRRAGAGASAARRRARWAGWLFALPALVMYAVFELYPVLTAVQYSFYDWDGIGVATPAGLQNYVRVFTEPQLVASIWHAFALIAFFSLLPVTLGLVVASITREIRSQFAGGVARTLMFLPQIIPGAASAIAWTWMYSPDGAVNQLLSAVGLGAFRKTWLGDFTWALPAVGIIGTWLATGLCTLLLLAGIGKIDASIYEAAQIDGANRIQQFFAITLPGLRSEIGVCITITVIAALASFDVVFMSTQGGPGYATTVPGVQVYQLAFTENRVGQSSALAVVLSLLVLAVILPLQRLFRER